MNFNVLYQKISTGSHICDQIALIMRGVVDYSVFHQKPIVAQAQLDAPMDLDAVIAQA